MKSDKLAEKAGELYSSGLSIDAVASELNIAYRTARKSIFMAGKTLRDPSARLIGRTRPDRKVDYNV